MAGYCPSSLSTFLASVDKHAKRERNQYPAILTERAWSIKDLLYGIPRIHVSFFFTFVFVGFCYKIVNIFFFVFILFDAFGFRHFEFLPEREAREKPLTVTKYIFRKRTFVHLLGLWPNFIAGIKRAIPREQYRSILSVRIASHIIIRFTTSRQRELGLF